MSIKFTCTCDGCGESCDPQDSVWQSRGTPPSWVTVVFGDPSADRDFDKEYHLCRSCVSKTKMLSRLVELANSARGE